MSDLKPILARIEAVLPHLATSAQLAELRGDLELKMEQFNAKLERLTGRVESLPTTWQMLTAIIAGQVTLAGLLCAAVFGAARLFGHL